MDAASTSSLWTRLRGPAGRRDLVAGLTVGAVVIPQSLAYADLAGMPPVTGLYAALAAMAVYAVVGSSPHASLGPTATSAILAAAAGSRFADDPERDTAALTAIALLAGGVALLAGVARLGFVSQLLSRPVLAGYTAGAAMVIAVGQISPLLGIELGAAARKVPVHEVVRELVRAADGPSAATVAVGLASVVALVLLGRLVPRAPAALVVVIGAMVTAEVLDLARHGVATVGQVPSGLPTLGWPDLSASDAGSLALAAAALALVGFAETTAQVQALTLEEAPAAGDGASADSHRPPPPDANRELLALGSANLASGLCGAFPVSGSFSRNAVNVRAGGRTRRAGAVSAVVVALTLVALTGLLDTLPRATLAAIVVVAVVSLVPLRTFRRLYRLQRDDFAYAMVALLGTVTLGILPGLAVAVALSIGGLLYRVTVVDTAVLGYVEAEDTWRRLDRHAGARARPGVLVVRFAGPLYFANASRLHREITELVAEADDDLHRVVVDGRTISHIDVTGLDMLASLHHDLADAGITLVMAGLRGPALDAFLRTDLVGEVGQHSLVYPTVRQATEPATDT